METSTPVIQVLSRNNYEEQHLVTLPNALPLPELNPSSIRVQTSIISLTANNLTYGRIGHLLSIWDIHPLPPSIPTEYSDPTKFGRIAAWGYATVLESNVSEIGTGAQIFGLLPIGTLPLDMQIRMNPEVPTQFFEISKHRENVMSLYNQYTSYPPSKRTEELKKSQAYDALFQIFFTTSYLINRFSFPWDSEELIPPAANWTLEKGTIDSKTVILIFADSGKTALALAYLLKSSRPAGTQPRTILGIGSSKSRSFAKETGLYDKVLTYDSDSDNNLDAKLDLKADSKILLVEFGSRGEAGNRWEDKFREEGRNVEQLIVAGEVVAESPEKANERFKKRTERGASVFNASIVRGKAIEVLGEKRFFEELMREWKVFKEGGLVESLRLVWGEGMEGVGKGWERLCEGGVSADQGLVFSLD
ncbi:uncharacterized protein LY89DRAFT_723476 [Mollisia scopiformis]|uniref:Uncharacterized protein n=1 Tax=Mollisia scopiformis TaxID=149040 RepID=A0A194WSP3_MOLSC|nr:uncharacterized protein LY89DRAFT_723476 [Mollisia scopiformis]KUJ10978.1 hypothetical protein LY89DRAFT_723476 [Mollisia scopiformis]